MRPIYDMLRDASGRGRFHMPGHKGRGPFGPVDVYALDTTELPVTDDLYAAERGLARAQELYARAAGAGATLMLHNGSTGGIHAMLQLWAGEGDTVILPRNAHMSAVNGCVLGGLRARWIPMTCLEDGYCFIREEDVLAAMERYPEAKAVLLTRPDFYGSCLQMKRIVSKAHAMGMKVVVDEAHGAHLPWLKDVASAGEMGADAWVQSVHKTLPGLTGAAVLNLRDGADKDKALRILRRGQTSSPSFILLMSMDDARAYMEEKGEKELARVCGRAEEIRGLLPGLGYADGRRNWTGQGLDLDPTRLVIEAPQGGARLAKQLRDRGIDVEMHDERRAVLILSAMDTDEDFAALRRALESIPASGAQYEAKKQLPEIPERAMEVRAAVMADCEPMPMDRAQGRIAAAAAGLYPPGIPLICPGERYSGEILAALSEAGNQHRFGTEGACVLCVTASV